MDDKQTVTREEFSSFITGALKKTSAREIANLCDICISTVSRWASGCSSPHPKIRKLIIQLIQEKLLNKTAG